MERLSMVSVVLLVTWLILFEATAQSADPFWDYDFDDDDNGNTTTPRNTIIENTTNLDLVNDDLHYLLTVNKTFGHSKYKPGLDHSDFECDDIIDLNVGGQKITTLRSTLTAVPNSKLALKFAKDDKSQTQQDTKPYFFDYNPVQFQYLLDQLKAIKRRPQTSAYELNFRAPDVDVPFDFSDMLLELGLNPDHFLSPLVGTHVNLPLNSLIGWSECYRSKYDTPFNMTVLNSTCNGKRLLVACRPSTDEKTLSVAGIGNREDLFPSCISQGYCYTTMKNNTGFYYLLNKAWGFEGRPENSTTTTTYNKFQSSYPSQAMQAPTYINPCDNSDKNSQYRLCWSLRSNSSGERCGSSKNLRNTEKWERLIYQAV